MQNLKKTQEGVAPMAMERAEVTRNLVPGGTVGIDSVGGGVGTTRCSKAPPNTKPAATSNTKKRQKLCYMLNQRHHQSQEEPTNVKNSKITEIVNQKKTPSPLQSK